MDHNLVVPGDIYVSKPWETSGIDARVYTILSMSKAGAQVMCTRATGTTIMDLSVHWFYRANWLHQYYLI